MSREAIYGEMEKMFGVVPSFLKGMPESVLEPEWKLFKTLQLTEGPIPGKYRALIGLAVAAAARCRYTALFYEEVARVNGATDEEIEHAVHSAAAASALSIYVNGLRIDYDRFSREMGSASRHIRALKAGGKKKVA